MKSFFTSCASALVILGLAQNGRVARAADPTTADCLSANENALALKNQHKLRAARSELLVCAAASCPVDVRNECTRRITEVNAAIPTIVFEAKDAAGSDLGAVKVSMDGQPFAEKLQGTPVSIDPGEHSFVFETSGEAPITKRFVIVEGDKDRRERITFGTPATTTVDTAAPVAPPTAAPGTATPAPVSTPPVAPDPASSWGKTQRILGWSATGVGVIGLALGVISEVQRSGKLSDRDAVCPSGANCPAGSQARINSLTDDAKTASTIGLASFVVGGLFVGGGLTLVFTAPRSEAPASGVAVAPVLGPQFQGVMVSNVW